MQISGADWLAEVQSLLVGVRGEASDVAGVVQVVISGSPLKLLTFYVTVTAGEITAFDLGRSSKPDVTVSCAYGDALAILAGELSVDAGYMSGALKVEGNYRWWLLDLRPVRAAALALAKDLSVAGHATS